MEEYQEAYEWAVANYHRDLIADLRMSMTDSGLYITPYGPVRITDGKLVPPTRGAQ